MISRYRNRGLALLAALAALAMGGTAAAQPLNRDPSAYCIFAQEHLSLKDVNVNSACNVGVNCGQPSAGSECGRADLANASFGMGSQFAADAVNSSKPVATFWQLFTNKPFNNANVVVNSPPVQSFTTPIIAGTCDANCVSSPSALEAFCNFPSPFPACDPSKPVTVKPGQDCIGVPDANPGNMACDLAAGAYGDIIVQNDGILNFGPGDFPICSFKAGRRVKVRGSGADLLIPDAGFFKLNNESDFGQQCGDLNVKVQGKGTVNFGRRVSVFGLFCGPQAQFNIGDSNNLTGQFIGLQIFGNRNNNVQFCGGFCTCVDSFEPNPVKEGATLTLHSQCNLNNATSVTICGLNAPITSQSASMLDVTVPAGAAAGSPCLVEVTSSTGVFRVTQLLTVNP